MKNENYDKFLKAANALHYVLNNKSMDDDGSLATLAAEAAIANLNSITDFKAVVEHEEPEDGGDGIHLTAIGRQAERTQKFINSFYDLTPEMRKLISEKLNAFKLEEDKIEEEITKIFTKGETK